MAGLKISVRESFSVAVKKYAGTLENGLITRKQLKKVVDESGITFPNWFCTLYSTDQRAVYDFQKFETDLDLAISEKNSLPSKMVKVNAFIDDNKSLPEPTQVSSAVSSAIQENDDLSISELVNKETYIPESNNTFVPFGYYAQMKRIIESRIFLPVFIAGLSGNGKTFTTEQICAELGRELIVVPITIETTEDDLLGGFRLVNGETVWSNGPVVEAMERGAICMLDEVDLASHKIMCLQSIIDGKGVYLKKINKLVRPEPGFNVVATANTKGKGRWKGQFIGTNPLNEAFLERFGVLFEQDYPSASVEKKILFGNLSDLGCDLTENDNEAKNFVTLLIEWANQIRRSYFEGNVTEIISTRRLIHIIKYYSIFRDKLDSVVSGTNRFSDDNKEGFVGLYVGMDNDPDVLKRLNEQTSTAPTVKITI